MKSLLLLALVGCADDASIVITSPKDGDTIAITGDVILAVDGHDVSKAGGIVVTSDGGELVVVSTYPYGACDECSFTLTFQAAALTPESHTIKVAMEYDLSYFASDEVTLQFVAP